MGIEFNGLDEIIGKLQANCTLNDVKTVVRHNGAELQIKMQRNAVFTRGYSTGTTKRSISLEMRDGDLTAAVGPGTEYSPYVEYGTRFMTPQPFVRPSFNEQKTIFKNDLQKLFK